MPNQCWHAGSGEHSELPRALMRKVVKKVLLYCPFCLKLRMVTKVYEGTKLTVTCDTCGGKLVEYNIQIRADFVEYNTQLRT
jgi:transcription elongation factor Elf1